MKSLNLLFSGALFLLVLLLVGTACERHPISQTIPGYTEKKNEQQKDREEKKLLPANKAPHFFH
ncbi:MAG: hypothetical protein ACH346_05405 [Chthoniobacterales bacterium]